MSRQEVLITAAELKIRLASFVLIDVGAEESGRNEGIAGAVSVPATAFAGSGGGVRGNRPLPDIAQLQDHVRSWGIDNDSEIVLYDDKGNLQAARGWWTLKWAGLTKVRLLDGGLAAAEQAGLPLAPFRPSVRKGQAVLSVGHLPVIEADEAAEYARQGRLLDARAPRAFNGDPETKTGGHIPGAINIPALGNLDEAGAFLPDATLANRFPTGGAVGVSCGAGVSAAHNAAALAILGNIPPLYVASWSGWSADASRPVAYGASVSG